MEITKITNTPIRYSVLYLQNNCFAILEPLQIEKCHHKWQKYSRNMKLATAWQPLTLLLQLQIIQTRWQHYADQQKCDFMSQVVESTVIAKGEVYDVEKSCISPYTITA
jgi:hypothetical protein